LNIPLLIIRGIPSRSCNCIW